jgi:hypothetical protein
MLRLGRAAGAALRCSGAQSRYYSDATKMITATLFPGDGIGPEIAEAVKQVLIRATARPSTMHARSEPHTSKYAVCSITRKLEHPGVGAGFPCRRCPH